MFGEVFSRNRVSVSSVNKNRMDRNNGIQVNPSSTPKLAAPVLDLSTLCFIHELAVKCCRMSDNIEETNNHFQNDRVICNLLYYLCIRCYHYLMATVVTSDEKLEKLKMEILETFEELSNYLSVHKQKLLSRKCIYQNSVSTYCSKLSVKLSIFVV